MLSNIFRSSWSAKASANPLAVCLLGGRGGVLLLLLQLPCLFLSYAFRFQFQRVIRHFLRNLRAPAPYELLSGVLTDSAGNVVRHLNHSRADLRNLCATTFTSRQHYVTPRHVTSPPGRSSLASQRLRHHVTATLASLQGGSRQHSGRDALGDRNFSAPLSSYGTAVIYVVRRGQKRRPAAHDGTLTDTIGVQS